MAPRRKRGRVYVLDIIPPQQKNLFDFAPPSESIPTHVARGARVTRYRREWIIGPTEVEDDVLTGRIGFVGEGPVAELWDETKKDFVDEEIRTGLTTPFAIHLKRLVAVVQERRPAISVSAVAGALQDILSQGAKEPDLRWQVTGRQGVRDLEVWLNTVSRVTRLSMMARVPNPNYRDAHDLKALMEQTEAEVIRLEMESDAGIDVRAPFIEQTQGHVDRGYGEATYVGEIDDRNGSHRSTFSTRVGVEIPSEELETEENGEVPTSTLRTELVRSIETEDTDRGDSDTRHT